MMDYCLFTPLCSEIIFVAGKFAVVCLPCALDDVLKK